ncbi:MAG: bifunctional metallophosphatase/5'-nucleotidase, partial [Solirubrobacteraceae bacterium]
GKTVDVQLIGLNDFHGHLEPTTPGTISPTGGANDRIPAGGAEYLATYIRDLERENRDSLVVSAGDLIGASPLLSALFHDEPTIEAMNKIGLDLNAVGNHEFDEGATELLRMQRGGCHPTDGEGSCKGPSGRFSGAKFDFLAANVVDSRGRTLFAPYKIERVGGVKIGFIGMTLEGTPDIVSPGGIQGLRFLDEADTANRYAREIKRRHDVEAIVVLLHEGGFQATGGGSPDACNGGLTGPIVDIVNRTDKAVDLFVTGHTHSPYNCQVRNKQGSWRTVTSASSFGRVHSKIDLEIERRSGHVVDVVAENRVTAQNVFKAQDISALIQHYTTLAAPLRDEVIGRITADITKTFDDSRENAAGNLIADAQLAATSSSSTGQAVAAFMNPGGVRDPGFIFAQSAGEGDGNVTFGEAFTVQPFGNSLVTMTLTGQQLLDALKQQWCGQGSATVLLPSKGVTYTYDVSDANALLGNPSCGSAPNPISNLQIGGVAVNPAGSYRITVNSFLADGGDRFTGLRSGTNRLGGAVDTDALTDYLAPSLTGAPIAPPALDRIAVVG